MIVSLARLVIPLALLLPMPALAGGLPPWRFGMSKSEVVRFTEFGPYRDFKNGDVETFNGRFHGHKENIQFFFEKGRLRRIGVYLWEGKDPKQGIPAWRRAYELLQKDYGKVKIPDIQVSPKSEPVNADVLGFVAAGHAYATGNTQMAPANQPNDMRVFARFMGAPFGNYFSVAIFFDPRP